MTLWKTWTFQFYSFLTHCLKQCTLSYLQSKQPRLLSSVAANKFGVVCNEAVTEGKDSIGKTIFGCGLSFI